MRRFFAMFTALLFLFLFAACAKPLTALNAEELLELGEKYLLELDYGQAAVHFTRLTEVEPKNPRGYTGLAAAYLGLGRQDDAIEVLEQGRTALPDSEPIEAELQELKPSPTPEPKSPLELLAEELIDIYNTSGEEGLFGRMVTDEYNRLEEEEMDKLSDSQAVFLLGDMGCGFYRDQNGDTHVYIGQYDGSLRSGEGLWIDGGFDSMGFEYRYIFIGNWEDDRPNGSGGYRAAYNSVDLGGVFRQTVTGTFAGGLYDGAINWRWLEDEEHTHNYDVTAENGSFRQIGVNEIGTPVAGYCTECGEEFVFYGVGGIAGFS